MCKGREDVKTDYGKVYIVNPQRTQKHTTKKPIKEIK